MAIQVVWNKIYYDEFLRLTFLTPFQRDVMDRHVYRVPNYVIAGELHCSPSAVDDAIRECKKMYDDVQPYSSILPKREKGKKTGWKRTEF